MSESNGTNNGGGLVPANQNLSAFIGGAGKGEYYSFDPSTREGGELLLKATLLEQEDLQSKANLTVKVMNFYANDVEQVEENGEITRFLRIVVFDEKGNPLSCGSEGVRKSLAVMFRIRGAMPWNPPVLCTVKVRKLDGAKQWMTLEPDLDSLYPQTAKRADQKSK